MIYQRIELFFYWLIFVYFLQFYHFWWNWKINCLKHLLRHFSTLFHHNFIINLTQYHLSNPWYWINLYLSIHNTPPYILIILLILYFYFIMIEYLIWWLFNDKFHHEFHSQIHRISFRIFFRRNDKKCDK